MTQVFHHNMRRYSDQNVVEEYLLKYYHKRRLELLVSFIAQNIEERYSQKRPVNILELAPGSTIVLDNLPQARVRVFGIEGSKEISEQLKHRGAKPVVSDLSTNFPFKDRQFDVVVAGEIIEHIFDVETFLGECNRVLLEGGYLSLTTPNLANIQDRLGFFFGKSPRHINPLHPYLYLHVRPFTPNMLYHCVRQKGFYPTGLRSNAIVWRFRNGTRLSWYYGAKMFPQLGGSLILNARKVTHD